MNLTEVRAQAWAMPLTSPIYPRGPYRFINREFMVISYRTDPERLAASGELRRLLVAAVEALPQEFRAVFVLREVEGLSTAETAACLAIRPETVKTRLHRARSRLQEALGEQLLAASPSLFEFDGARCDRVVGHVLARLGQPMAPEPPPSAMAAEPVRRVPRWLGRALALIERWRER